MLNFDRKFIDNNVACRLRELAGYLGVIMIDESNN